MITFIGIKRREVRSVNPIIRLIVLMTELETVVGMMSDLYDKHPELNDEVVISDLIPHSLDEWDVQLQHWLMKHEGGELCLEKE